MPTNQNFDNKCQVIKNNCIILYIYKDCIFYKDSSILTAHKTINHY